MAISASPSLKRPGESIFTQGETIEEIHEMVRDAVQRHFEAEQRPKLIRLHIVRDIEISSSPTPRSPDRGT
ncbi:type II toxin-antitoxin system HicB family antitoxin [Egbenema bharatensis]|uniref:type II toxin-antitoxin system HicB family antitoxin n=1 Tax=Egbenema bharatensis TaxID=3463334 RepID=UPI003A8452F0